MKKIFTIVGVTFIALGTQAQEATMARPVSTTEKAKPETQENTALKAKKAESAASVKQTETKQDAAKADAAKALSTLSPEQKEQLQQTQMDYKRKREDLAGVKEPDEKKQEKLKQLNADEEMVMKKILSPEQMEKYLQAKKQETKVAQDNKQ